MAENIFTETFDDREVIQKLENIERKIQSLGKEADAMGEEMDAAFSTGASSASDMTAALDKNASAVSKQAAAVAAAERQNRSWLGAIRETVLGIQIGNKSLGEWGQSAVDFAGRINLGEKALGGMSAGMRILGLAIKASGIGLLVGIVAGLIQYFTKFQSGVDKVSRVMAGFSAVVDQLVRRSVEMGKSILSAATALGKLVTLDYEGFKKNATESVNSFKSATDNLTDSLVNAATSAYELEKRSQALRDSTLTASVQIAREKVAIEDLKRAYDDEGKTITARATARKQAFDIEKKLIDEEVDRAVEALEIAKEKFALNRDDADAKESYAQAEIFFQDAIAGRNQIIAEGEKDLRDLRKTASEQRKKQLDDESKLLDKINKDLEALRVAATPEGIEKDIAATQKKYDDLIRLAGENEAKLVELQSKRQLTPDELAKLEEFNKIQVELEKRKYEAIQSIFGEYVERQIKADEELAKAQADAQNASIEKRREAAEKRRDLALSEIEITEQEFDNLIKTLEAGGAKKEALETQRDIFETQIKQNRIQAEIAYQQALLPLIDKGDKDQQQLIINRIEALKKALEGLEIPEPANGGGQPRNIWDLLGIEDPGDQEALGKAVSQVIDSLDQLSEARIRDAEAARRAADEKVRAAEDALKAEQDAAEKGFANNVDLKQRELDEAKKQRDAALKEEAKARKQQILLDGALQVSGLVTSSVNIFKSLSSLGPLGIALAVGTIGLMFGAFAKAKADALKVASAPKLRKGRKFDGPTHEQGNEDLVHDGRGVFAVEKDEWLIGTDHSKEHDRFLANLNHGRYRGVDLYSLGERARSDYSRSPLREATPRIQALITERADLEERNKYQALAAAYDRGVDKITAEIRRKPVTAPWKQGYKIIKDTGHGTETTTVQPTE